MKNWQLVAVVLAGAAAAAGGYATMSPTRATSDLAPARQPLDPAFEASCNGQRCTFTDVSQDPNQSLQRRLWTFGDGESAEGAVVAHTYSGVGTYEVTLTVWTAYGKGSISRKVAVEGLRPATRRVVMDLKKEGRAIVVRGSVSGATPACLRGGLTIQRLERGQWIPVQGGGLVPQEGGAFDLTLPKEPGRYRVGAQRVVIPGEEACPPAVSRTVTVTPPPTPAPTPPPATVSPTVAPVPTYSPPTPPVYTPPPIVEPEPPSCDPEDPLCIFE